MKNKTILAAAFITVMSSMSMAATIDLGLDSVAPGQGSLVSDGPITVNISDMVTGAADFGAGVSFDLVFTFSAPVATATIQAQPAGLGINSGVGAGSGFDNGVSGARTTEAVTFEIENIIGASAIEITNIGLIFSADAGDAYSIDGGAAVATTMLMTDIVLPAPTTSVQLAAATLPSDGDARFAIDNLTLTVTPIPEPSSALLVALGGLALIRRRR